MAGLESFGLDVGIYGALANPETILQLAGQAEAAGFEFDLARRSRGVPGLDQVEVSLQCDGRLPLAPFGAAHGARGHHGRAGRRDQARAHRHRRADHALPQSRAAGAHAGDARPLLRRAHRAGRRRRLARGGVQRSRRSRLQAAGQGHRRVPRDLQGDLRRRRGRPIAARPTPSSRSSPRRAPLQRPAPADPDRRPVGCRAAPRRPARQRLAGGHGRPRDAGGAPRHAQAARTRRGPARSRTCRSPTSCS